MKYLFIFFCILFSAIYYVTKFSFGFGIGTPLYTHFSFSFVHLNILVLFINMFAFYKMYDVVYLKLKEFTLPLAFTISFLASFFCEYQMPTIGASGIVFSLVGMYFSLFKQTKKSIITNAILLTIVSIIQYFGNVNVLLHGVCLGGGVLIGLLINKHYELKKNN